MCLRSVTSSLDQALQRTSRSSHNVSQSSRLVATRAALSRVILCVRGRQSRGARRISASLFSLQVSTGRFSASYVYEKTSNSDRRNPCPSTPMASIYAQLYFRVGTSRGLDSIQHMTIAGVLPHTAKCWFCRRCGGSQFILPNHHSACPHNSWRVMGRHLP